MTDRDGNGGAVDRSADEDYHCVDCSEKFHTELGAEGHSAMQSHEIENIRTGKVVRYE